MFDLFERIIRRTLRKLIDRVAMDIHNVRLAEESMTAIFAVGGTPITKLLLVKKNGRIRVMDSLGADGRKYITEGVTNQDEVTPWLIHCDERLSQ